MSDFRSPESRSEGMANVFRPPPASIIQHMPRRKRTDFVTPVIIVLLGLIGAAMVVAIYWSGGQ